MSLRPSQTRFRSRDSSSTASYAAHKERCQKCKSAVAALLQKLYGPVETQKQFAVGAKPDDFRASAYAPDLREIFEALQNRRGFADFVRTAVVPPCDYYLPGPAFVVEFDESQHFTPLRQLALSRYPLLFPAGFDRGKWIDLCRRI